MVVVLSLFPASKLLNKVVSLLTGGSLHLYLGRNYQNSYKHVVIFSKHNRQQIDKSISHLLETKVICNFAYA